MIQILPEEGQNVNLFVGNKTPSAVSRAIRRIDYVEHALHVWETDEDGSPVTVQLQASSASLPAEAWADVGEPVTCPGYVILPRGPYWGVRLVKSATARGVSATFVSSRPGAR